MPHKLLLADDSVTIQRVIELTFADEDVQVIAVGDGQKAIERIEAERPDIVLADVGMPERDGYEVAAFVKGTPHLAHIPVLLLTGAFEPVDEQRASAAGCDGVLAKPFEPHMVITRVKELLSGGPGARAPQADASGAAEIPAPAAAATDPGAVEPPEAPPADAPIADRASGVDAPASMLAVRAADTSARFDRRTPIAVPGFGAPPAPSESQVAALDDYFDRLDAAFSTLQQAPAQPGVPDPAPPAPGSDAPAAAASRCGSHPSAGGRSSLRRHRRRRRQSRCRASPRRSRRCSRPSAGRLPRTFRRFIGPAAMPQASVDDLVERVTRQVLERMSDRVVRDTVTDLVSRVAERLVRDEIERVKATLK